ncbi:MAG: aminotransferase class III-fold pyridoxal phosphate-dependent enzyme, partial [Chloroflexota bacterium]|nr:aminotransferase class III-fold pyridoxal phosphate-dependent enzyme [Chloroflexota bacterium]
EVAALSYVVPPNDPAQVEAALEAHDDIAAVILEPTGASMGHKPVYPEFLHALRDLTQKHGVLLVFDEVVTGFRVSPGGAQALYGVTPDVTTLAKILAGGLPGGAVCGRADIIDMIAHGDHTGDNRVAHPGTFNANPISASAGAAALQIVATGEPNAIADARATTLRAGLNDLMTRMEVPGCCYGVASIFQVRLGAQCQCSDAEHLRPAEGQSATSPALVSAMRLAAINAGVDLMSGRPSGLVSAAHTEADIQSTLAGFEQAFTALRGDGML